MRPTPTPATLRNLLLLFCLLPVPAVAATLAVPGQHPTIQGAIVVAQAGDVVEVAPGSYIEQIDFLGKAITVRATQGPAGTTIDGGGVGPVVQFVTSEGAGSVLEGFTVRNGHLTTFAVSSGGGGILVDNASPTIRGNVIRDNAAAWNGAGAYLVNSQSLVVDNVFRDNSFIPVIADAPYGRGAGLGISGGAPTITHNRFTNNFGTDQGGGVYCADAQTAIISHNRFEGNSSGFGGGIAIDGNSDVVANNNLIVGNHAIGHSSFAGPGEGFGGGVYISGPSSAVFRNATIVGNSCNAGWTGPGAGGGVHVSTILAAAPYFENSVVRDNVANLDPQLSGNLTVAYSNVLGTPTAGTNFDADPLFVVGPDGGHYLSQVAAGQGVDSPNLDAGNPMSALFPNATTRTDQIADTGTIDVGFHFPSGFDAPFIRGDCNADGSSNLADAVVLLTFLFPLTPTPPILACDDACDGNDDGSLNISDAVALLNALFGSPALPLAPPIGTCGSDPTPEALGCASFAGC